MNAAFSSLSALALGACMCQPDIAIAQSRAIQPTRDISSERLDRYADVLAEVMTLRREAHGKLEALPLAQRPALQRQLSSGIARALEKAGLEPSEFNRISKRVELDPALRRRVRQRVMKEIVGV